MRRWPLPLLLLLAPPPAAAVDGGEWQLCVTAGYARLRVDGRDAGGGLGRVAGHYGLTDAWSVRGELGSSWHGVEAGTARASEIGGGITYALDIVRIIPFAEAGVSLVDVGGAVTRGRRDLGLSFGLGGDYLIDRRWSLAAVARYEHQALAPASQSRPGLLSVGLRLGYAF